MVGPTPSRHSHVFLHQRLRKLQYALRIGLIEQVFALQHRSYRVAYHVYSGYSRTSLDRIVLYSRLSHIEQIVNASDRIALARILAEGVSALNIRNLLLLRYVLRAPGFIPHSIPHFSLAPPTRSGPFRRNPDQT